MKSTRKRVASGVALLMAVVLALTGTFAWQSISQQAKNEAQKVVNPGGRLHDDFDGKNKDIYVENFTDTETGMPIFARIRLDEYMEIGRKAGEPTGTDGKWAKSLVKDAKLEDESTWTPHILGESTFSKYWKWDTGGETTYMPTFNKNKDSLKADINGTYAGKDPDDDKHYDDYVDYSLPENSEKTAGAVYDRDTNNIDEGIDAVEGKNIKTEQETHTAQPTLRTTNVMSMKDWLDLPEEQKTGPYWVWDTDGWAYWGQAIQPQSATGLFLDGVELNRRMDDSFYYGINVIGQFITADDLGKANSTGFYDPSVGSNPTENAEKLLKAIGVGGTDAEPGSDPSKPGTDPSDPGTDPDEPDPTPVKDPTNIRIHVEYPQYINWSTEKQVIKFRARAVYYENDVVVEDAKIGWEVRTEAGTLSPDTKIDQDGTLTIAANEQVHSYIITAYLIGNKDIHSGPILYARGPETVDTIISAAGGVQEYKPGDTVQFSAKTTMGPGGEPVEVEDLTWSVFYNTSPNTKIDPKTGKLTIGKKEAGFIAIQVRGTYEVNGVQQQPSCTYYLAPQGK